MRTGAAADHAGCFHAAMYYGSEAELAEALVPFLLDGVATGEPTLVSAREGVSSVLRAALPADSGVGFLPGEEYYARPAVTIRAYRKLLAEYVAEGFEQVRVVGEVPAEAATWDWWARYEAVINEAYEEFPVWGVCTYDTRSTPSWILDDVARTHPRFAERDGAHRVSPSYAPAALLGERRVPAADPLQAGPPVFELRDPNVAFVRQALAAHHGGVLSAAAFGDFQVAVDEVTTNAIEHGLPPVTVRLWRGETRLVVTVTDGGAGPTDPAAGLLPAAKAPLGGLGLWMAYQLCDHVTFGPGEDGRCTVRLTAGQ